LYQFYECSCDDVPFPPLAVKDLVTVAFAYRPRRPGKKPTAATACYAPIPNMHATIIIPFFPAKAKFLQVCIPPLLSLHHQTLSSRIRNGNPTPDPIPNPPEVSWSGGFTRMCRCGNVRGSVWRWPIPPEYRENLNALESRIFRCPRGLVGPPADRIFGGNPHHYFFNLLNVCDPPLRNNSYANTNGVPMAVTCYISWVFLGC